MQKIKHENPEDGTYIRRCQLDTNTTYNVPVFNVEAKVDVEVLEAIL
jgi:hypothetical protein